MAPKAEGTPRRIRVARASLDRRTGGWPGRHACLLDAGRHLGPPQLDVDGYTRRGRRRARAARRRGVGRPGASRVVAAGFRVRPRDSVLRLGTGRGLPARDAGGLHLECGGVRVVAVRAGLTRDRSARARCGGLGRQLASLPPAAADADFALRGGVFAIMRDSSEKSASARELTVRPARRVRHTRASTA